MVTVTDDKLARRNLTVLVFAQAVLGNQLPMAVWVGVRLSVGRSVEVFVCRSCVLLFGRLAVPLVPACHGH